MKKILILGLGNTLLSDEGFGPNAIEYLRENYNFSENVRLVDGGTGGLLLLGDFFDSDIAVILDIMLGQNEPGTFYELGSKELETLSSRYSMHQTSVSDIIASLRLAGSDIDVLLFGMEPYDFKTVSASLTDKAQQKLPLFCQKVVNRLKELKILD